MPDYNPWWDGFVLGFAIGAAGSLLIGLLFCKRLIQALADKVEIHMQVNNYIDPDSLAEDDSEPWDEQWKQSPN